MAVTIPGAAMSRSGARSAIVTKSSARRFHQMRNIASSTPKSPIRLTRKAFLPASALASSENQKPISR